MKLLEITCRRASQLSSESQDRLLSWRERIALRFHNALCVACRRYCVQIEWMDSAIQRFIRQEEQLPPAPGKKLPGEARERIRSRLSSLDKN